MTNALLSLLPKGLESLEVWRWPTPIDFERLADGPKNLTKLSIASHLEENDNLFDYSLIPDSVVDLRMTNPYNTIETEGYTEKLKCLPPSLTRLALTDLHPTYLRLLPQSLTDLELSSTYLQEEDAELDINIEEELGNFLPNLKRFSLDSPSEDSGVYPWEYASLMPGLETLHLNSHRDDEDLQAEDVPVGSHWKHFADGNFMDGPEWSKFAAKLPRSLKSYHLPHPSDFSPYERTDFSMVENLPPGLTALSMDGIQYDPRYADPLPFAKLPRHLTYLKFPDLNGIADCTPQDFPPTLRLFETGDYDLSLLPANLLPPYCKTVPYAGEEPFLRGAWWRYTKPLTDDALEERV